MMAIACVFPGQGAQSVGMLAELASARPVIRQTFAEASDVLGYDLWELTQNGPEEELNQTDRTQPAMLAAGVACYRAWRSAGGAQPVVMAGHSLGEYTALVCAGALSFAGGVALVADRGRYMQAAVPAGVGAMAALLGLDDGVVEGLCDEFAAGETVAAVNYNAPGQIVIAGHAAAVARVVEAAKARGAKRAVSLAVSAPSHCALMEPAARRLEERLSGLDLRAPEIPVIHNVDAAVHGDPEAIRRVLAAQVASPVRWVDTVTAFSGHGVRAIVECGPGKVLAGLNRRINRDVPTLSVFSAEILSESLAAVTGP